MGMGTSIQSRDARTLEARSGLGNPGRGDPARCAAVDALSDRITQVHSPQAYAQSGNSLASLLAVEQSVPWVPGREQCDAPSAQGPR